jgi:hypothetical protein
MFADWGVIIYRDEVNPGKIHFHFKIESTEERKKLESPKFRQKPVPPHFSDGHTYDEHILNSAINGA